MTRFIKQRDKYSCGPVAAVNMCKWRGENATYDDVYRFQEYMETEPPDGTFANKFTQIVQSMGAERMRSPNAVKMRQALKAGQALVIHAYYGRNKGHYYMIVGETVNNWIAVNFAGKTINPIEKRRFYRHEMKAKEFRVWTVDK